MFQPSRDFSIPCKHQGFPYFSLHACRSPGLECIFFRSSYGCLFSLFRYYFKRHFLNEAVETFSIIYPTTEHYWLTPRKLLKIRHYLSLPVEARTRLECSQSIPHPGFQISREQGCAGVVAVTVFLAAVLPWQVQ